MILVTHAIAGAALTQNIPNYGAAFVLGVLSHYIFDMIPHWHYQTPHVKYAVDVATPEKSLRFERHLVPEFIEIAVDAGLGMVLAFYFFSGDPVRLLLAAFGGILPDILVGFSKFYPNKILHFHYLMHRAIHTNIRLDDRPIIGIGSQALLVLLLVLVFR